MGPRIDESLGVEGINTVVVEQRGAMVVAEGQISCKIAKSCRVLTPECYKCSFTGGEISRCRSSFSVTSELCFSAGGRQFQFLIIKAELQQCPAVVELIAQISLQIQLVKCIVNAIVIRLQRVTGKRQPKILACGV